MLNQKLQQKLLQKLSPQQIMLMKLFPTAVIYLESALLHYGYTDRIPATWQIAVDKNIGTIGITVTAQT